MNILTDTGLGHLIEKIKALVGRFKEEQNVKDQEQDAAIAKAQEAADTALGYFVVVDDQLGWKAVPVVTTQDNGLIPKLPDDAEKFFNGIGEWVKVSTDLAAPDPRVLNELITAATVLHDEAYIEDQDDPLIGSWQSSQEDINKLQNAIDAAKEVSANYLKTVFTQAELDEATTALQNAIDIFKAASKEVIKNLEEFESLKARIKAVNDLVKLSNEEGREITFGDSWIPAEARPAMDKILSDATDIIEATRLQSVIDSTCDTLDEAVAAYEELVKVAAPNTVPLETEIERANGVKAGVLVSSDPEGHDLEMGTEFVLDQAIIDTLVEAINAAEQIKISAQNQNELNAATAELTAAIEAFKDQVRKTFDWYDIPEELDWNIVPWKWVPFDYDWTRFPWERVDYNQADIDRMPWDIEAAMDALADNAGGMDNIVSSDKYYKMLESDIATDSIIENQTAIDSMAKNPEMTFDFYNNDLSHDKFVSSMAMWAAMFKVDKTRDKFLQNEKASSQITNDLTDRELAEIICIISGIDFATHGTVLSILTDADAMAKVTGTNSVGVISSSKSAMRDMMKAPAACASLENSQISYEMINHCVELNVSYTFITKNNLQMFLTIEPDKQTINTNAYVITAGDTGTDGEYTVEIGHIISGTGNGSNTNFNTLGIAKDIPDGIAVNKFVDYIYLYKHPGTNPISVHGWTRYLPIE